MVVETRDCYIVDIIVDVVEDIVYTARKRAAVDPSHEMDTTAWDLRSHANIIA